MRLNLDGRHALVAGGTQGIGRAVAEVFAQSGATVCVLGRDPVRLEAVVAELPAGSGQRHAALVADMADTEVLSGRIAAYVAAHGPVHVLVNNTGGPPPGPAHSASPEAFEQAFRQHLLAFHTLVQAVLPGMRDAGMGRIINIISTSVKQPLPDLGVSNTIRGAVANWSKTLANELGPLGITVNNVLPGATSTERLNAIIARKAGSSGRSPEAVAGHMMAEVPLRRFARPEEIAWAVLFLASQAGAYINGINLPVDGGRTACL